MNKEKELCHLCYMNGIRIEGAELQKTNAAGEIEPYKYRLKLRRNQSKLLRITMETKKQAIEATLVAIKEYLK